MLLEFRCLLAKLINNSLGGRTSFIVELQISRIGDTCRFTAGINCQSAPVLIFWPIGRLDQFVERELLATIDRAPSILIFINGSLVKLFQEHLITTLHHELIDSPQIVVSKTLAEVNHHRGIKGLFARVSLKTEKKLDVWIFTDLFNGFLVGQS